MEEVEKVYKNIQERVLRLCIDDSKVEKEHEKDFGPRLRLVKMAQLIQEIGNQLHCSIITIAKAQVLYHQFQRLKKNSDLKTLEVAAACLILSIKFNQEDVTIEEVIIKFIHMAQDLNTVPMPIRRDPSSEELQDMKRKLCSIEYTVCKVLGFKNFRIAHSYVFKFLAQLQSLPDVSETAISTISTTVMKLLSTYYLCEGCIDFDAVEIATACLQFVDLFHGGVTSSIHYILMGEFSSISNKNRTYDILNDMIIASDVSTILTFT
ncbi:uncharacterized protein LOC129983551 [Argiope bruennichi]|uniref:uncharacterized protein LOC129983551 n=1 Tax=Argiope bruennichi TaxID=94029 RepID=UPI002494AF17|nr:uncharacterized protein LOC129983551 [Argiope bruennichi]XP_055949052.1 uncharacterized protein LOC129983551 [Argiope bruennichi]XP_055949053.1 uncharacterized protein LOC129983551 [Argiope bruennichi]